MWDAAYLAAMRLLRIFALVLVGLGLLVQGPAYAAAQPAASARCAEMMRTEQAPNHRHKTGTCGDMQAGCVFGMNCVAPLVAPDMSGETVPVLGDDALYSMFVGPELAATVHGPEPPPPQAHS